MKRNSFLGLFLLSLPLLALNVSCGDGKEARDREIADKLVELNSQIDAFQKLMSQSNPDLNWDNLKTAAEAYLKNEYPLADPIAVDSRSAGIATLIIFMDFDRSSIKEACFSKHLTELESKCIPHYAGYIEVLESLLEH